MQRPDLELVGKALPPALSQGACLHASIFP
jgi:hypothetical protein